MPANNSIEKKDEGYQKWLSEVLHEIAEFSAMAHAAKIHLPKYLTWLGNFSGVAAEILHHPEMPIIENAICNGGTNFLKEMVDVSVAATIAGSMGAGMLASGGSMTLAVSVTGVTAIAAFKAAKKISDPCIRALQNSCHKTFTLLRERGVIENSSLEDFIAESTPYNDKTLHSDGLTEDEKALQKILAKEFAEAEKIINEKQQQTLKTPQKLKQVQEVENIFSSDIWPADYSTEKNQSEQSSDGLIMSGFMEVPFIKDLIRIMENNEDGLSRKQISESLGVKIPSVKFNHMILTNTLVKTGVDKYKLHPDLLKRATATIDKLPNVFIRRDIQSIVNKSADGVDIKLIEQKIRNLIKKQGLLLSDLEIHPDYTYSIEFHPARYSKFQNKVVFDASQKLDEKKLIQKILQAEGNQFWELAAYYKQLAARPPEFHSTSVDQIMKAIRRQYGSPGNVWQISEMDYRLSNQNPAKLESVTGHLPPSLSRIKDYHEFLYDPKLRTITLKAESELYEVAKEALEIVGKNEGSFTKIASVTFKRILPTVAVVSSIANIAAADDKVDVALEEGTSWLGALIGGIAGGALVGGIPGAICGAIGGIAAIQPINPILKEVREDLKQAIDEHLEQLNAINHNHDMEKIREIFNIPAETLNKQSEHQEQPHESIFVPHFVIKELEVDPIEVAIIDKPEFEEVVSPPDPTVSASEAPNIFSSGIWPADIMTNPSQRETATGNGFTLWHIAVQEGNHILSEHLRNIGAEVLPDYLGRHPHQMPVKDDVDPLSRARAEAIAIQVSMDQANHHFNNGINQLKKTCSNIDIKLETLAAAIHEFSRAADLNPFLSHATEYKEAVNAEKEAQQQKQRVKEANQHFNNGINQLKKNYGNDYIRLETVAAAINEFDKAVELNPTLSDAIESYRKSAIDQTLHLSHTLGGYNNKQVKQYVPPYILPYVEFYDPIDDLISTYQNENKMVKPHDDNEREKQLIRGKQHFDNGIIHKGKKSNNQNVAVETSSAVLDEFKKAAINNPAIFDTKEIRDFYKHAIKVTIEISNSLDGYSNTTVKQHPKFPKKLGAMSVEFNSIQMD